MMNRDGGMLALYIGLNYLAMMGTILAVTGADVTSLTSSIFIGYFYWCEITVHQFVLCVRLRKELVSNHLCLSFNTKNIYSICM